MNKPFRSFVGLGLIVFVILVLPGMPVVQVYGQYGSSGAGSYFGGSNSPVYDQSGSFGSGADAYSIDDCLALKEFSFNELHDIWVRGLTRCKFNSRKVLSPATSQGVSELPEDEAACVGHREGEIIINGKPSETQAKRWSEHCSYLGVVGGAGPIDSSRRGLLGQNDFFSSGQPYNPVGDVTGGGEFEPLYTGPGVQVPSEDLLPEGISRERSLSRLIIFYTNATLPYVSVISVFAFVASGIFYILSFAQEALREKAKTMMIYVVIGIVIIFSAYTVVNTLLRFADF